MSIVLPALPVPSFVLFPCCTVSLQFGFPALQSQLRLAEQSDGRLVVAHSVQGSEGWVPSRFGCVAEVRALETTPQGLQATLAGLTRVEILGESSPEGPLFWECQILESQKWSQKKMPELPGLPEKLRACRSQLPAELWLDVVAFHLPHLPLEQKLALLAEADPGRRYYQLLESTRKERKKGRLSWN